MGNAGMYYAAGPWHHDPELSMHGTELVYGKDGYLICDAGRIPVRSQQTRAANARLIAAAPALAEALALVEGMLDAFPGFDSRAVPFTDKATGNIGEVVRSALRAAGVIE